MGEVSGSSINHLVDGSGLPGDIPSLMGLHQAASPSDAWLSSATTPTGNITFNLNGTYSLAGFSLWNFNYGNVGGVKGVTVTTSTDGISYTAVTGAPTQFAIGANIAPESPEQFSFAPVNASYVKFQVLSNYGGFFGSTGLSEVQFNSSSASATSVPEPLTIFGTFMGLGGGAALKRRLKGIKSKSA
jgi:hypothetical protein